MADAEPGRAPVVPTFAEYIPTVADTVSPGTLRAYGSYWNRITTDWGHRRLCEPTASEIRALAEKIKTGAVKRRNTRGGRGAAENFLAALRWVYRHAEDDDLIAAADNPARKVAKPRRLASTRRAVQDERLPEINHVAATTGTACSAAHHPTVNYCATPTANRSPNAATTTSGNASAAAWCGSAIQQISTHWLRHTTLTWVERHFGYAIARAYAGHADTHDPSATSTYVKATINDVAAALSALTGEPHPLAHHPPPHIRAGHHTVGTTSA